MKYSISNGRILTQACEINAVHHCNMRCRGCSHLSPVLAKSHADPEIVGRSLTTLAKVLAPEFVKIVGGEPCLHPNFIGLLDSVIASGISDRIRIISNASMPARITDEILSRIDELHLSIYPGCEPDRSSLVDLEKRADAFQVNLEIKHFDYFREPLSLTGTQDQELVRRIYNTCKIAHAWHCHTVEGEIFTKCPQSVFLSLKKDGKDKVAANGVLISPRPSLFDDILSYLESAEPLSACSNCLGSVGKLYSHTQVARSDWERYQIPSTEMLLDAEYLQELECAGLELDNLCERQHWSRDDNTPRLQGKKIPSRPPQSEVL